MPHDTQVNYQVFVPKASTTFSINAGKAGFIIRESKAGYIAIGRFKGK